MVGMKGNVGRIHQYVRPCARASRWMKMNKTVSNRR
jgi:hypothetical protein